MALNSIDTVDISTSAEVVDVARYRAALGAIAGNFDALSGALDALVGQLATLASQASLAELSSRVDALSGVSALLSALDRRVDFLGLVNPKDFGARGDVVEVYDAQMSAGSNALSSASSLFRPEDVGKVIAVLGAGPTPLGTILKTTVTEYVDAQHVNLGAAASFAVTGTTAQWGTDDTAAIQAALDSVAMSGPNTAPASGNKLVLNAGRAVFLPPGAYYCSTQQHARTALLGLGPSVSRLVLPPLTDANVWQNYGASAANHDDMIVVSGVGIEGNRTFQLASSVNGNGMVLWNAGSGFPIQICKSSITNVAIRECINRGLWGRASQGEIHVSDVNIDTCRLYGLSWNIFDCHIANVSAGGCGSSAIVVGVSAASCRFSNVKGWFSGNGGTNQLDQSTWQVLSDGASFSNCESQESKGCGWTVSGPRNQFANCRADDTGDVTSVVGGTLPTNRAAWNLDGAQDNVFQGCTAGLAVKPNNNYATAALRLANNADQNRGTFFTQARTRISGDRGGTATLLQPWNSAGVYQKTLVTNASGILFNDLTVDGTPVS